MNYQLPKRGVLSMHCSVNGSGDGEGALFFGLSGTGKTTVSADPERRWIGDDEPGCRDDGVFNIEGGCYAKTNNLYADLELLIWQATRRLGTVLENVAVNVGTRRMDLEDSGMTENTRAAYPIGFIDNHVREGRAGHPRCIFFLTADAAGALPPVVRLTPALAMSYALSGDMSKLAGTEEGRGAEPAMTFSAGFGALILPLPPATYARLLGEKLAAQFHQNSAGFAERASPAAASAGPLMGGPMDACSWSMAPRRSRRPAGAGWAGGKRRGVITVPGAAD